MCCQLEHNATGARHNTFLARLRSRHIFLSRFLCGVAFFLLVSLVLRCVFLTFTHALYVFICGARAGYTKIQINFASRRKDRNSEDSRETGINPTKKGRKNVCVCGRHVEKAKRGERAEAGFWEAVRGEILKGNFQDQIEIFVFLNSTSGCHSTVRYVIRLYFTL